MRTVTGASETPDFPHSSPRNGFCNRNLRQKMAMIDSQTLLQSYQVVRRELLAMRDSHGVWRGRLSSSPLATATSVSALSLFCNRLPGDPLEAACRQLAHRGVDWLLSRQNSDGGWSDTDRSQSNISTTLLAMAALRLAGAGERAGAAISRAEEYVQRQGGTDAVRRRYGKDRTFAVPILMNCALAGIVDWSAVGSLPFEWACLPHRFWRWVRLPVVSYALPALVAVGQACYHHRKPWNPFTRIIRGCCRQASLSVIEPMQPVDGGFLEAIPLTAFVTMALCSIGAANHPVARRGVKFLLNAFRDDGGCPIDIDLAVWNTTLSVVALAKAAGNVGALGCLDWLLRCQHAVEHPFTHAPPGGWAWTDLSGGVPDADDTSGALLALRALKGSAAPAQHSRIDSAAASGIRWLLDLQNRDGGWPTFCCGWGALPFDRSAPDLTAHAIRALSAWLPVAEADSSSPPAVIPDSQGIEAARGTASGFPAKEEMTAAMTRGFEYLLQTQQADGSWIPLWFGNQFEPNEENRVYGTSRVLLSFAATGRAERPEAARAVDWLISRQSADGGWGGDRAAVPRPSSVEETAVALESLLAIGADRKYPLPIEAAIQWLIGAVESGQFREPSPIGLYFAKLWYYEQTYPVAFTLAALGEAVRQWLPGDSRGDRDD